MDVKLKEQGAPPPISESQADQIKQWFADKGGGDNPCSVCGTTVWSIGAHWVLAPTLSPRGIALNQVYPFVMIFCTRCGNTHFFHAGMIGVLPGPEKDLRPVPPAEPGSGPGGSDAD